MPYKNKEDKLKSARRCYRNNWPASKDNVVERNRRWKKENYAHFKEKTKEYNIKMRNRYKLDGRCTRCSAKIDDDERTLYGVRSLCERCYTIKKIIKYCKKTNVKLDKSLFSKS